MAKSSYGYTSAELTASTGLMTGVDSTGRRTAYDPQVWFSAEANNIMSQLEGPNSPDTRAISVRFDDLTQGGITVVKNIYHPPTAEMNVMDQDLYGYEDAIQSDPISISIAAHRKTWLLSELQKQYPAEQLDAVVAKLARNYLIKKNAKLALSCILEKQLTGADSSGYLYGALDMSTYYSRNQVYPNGKFLIEHLDSGDLFTRESLSIADVILSSGYRATGDQTFRALDPVINGEQVKSLVLMHPIVEHQLKILDADFKDALVNADARGPGNRTWQGLGKSFKYDGHLIWILTDELADVLLINAGDTIYNADGTASVAGSPCVVTPMLKARSILRVVGRRPEESDAREGYDLNWFTRYGVAAVQGYASGQVNHPDESAVRELGRCLIYSYCEHPAAHTYAP